MSASESVVPARKRRSSVVKDLLETVVLTLIIFLVVRVALQNFRVEGTSMLPNLHNGEYILVNKVDYMFHSPQRGDIIVFRAVPAGQPDKDFIKRVIGLPGDRVAIKNNRVFVNGRSLSEPYAHYPSTSAFGPQIVPAGDYFVLGDNRGDSYDSSRWPSPWLPRGDIIGKALIAYWPLRDISLFPTPTYATRRS